MFVVKKDGSISDVKTVRGVDPYLDKEAERVIAAMPNWKPGKQRGQAVNVRFTVPVTFRLSGPEPAKPAETPEAVAIEKFEEVVVVGYGPKEATPNNEPTFKVVDEMPKFPGGQEGLMRYLAKNIKYPTMAQQNKEQGKVLVQIVIGKDGNGLSVLFSWFPFRHPPHYTNRFSVQPCRRTSRRKKKWQII